MLLGLALPAAVLGMTILGSVASLMLKMASGNTRSRDLLTDWHFHAGGLGYLAAALINIWVLRHLDLSVVLPLTALTYVWTLLIARAFLGERLTWRKLAGVGLILLGVVLIAST
ncbi:MULTISPECIES: EamA family transporter [unclassified Luteococcus]|uniref:EamA family transporter n=1 Tax=unclassified Luteococcus TaxID=2639923 RepID=UPI00313F10FC